MYSIFYEMRRAEEILRASEEVDERRLKLLSAIKGFVLGGSYSSYSKKHVLLNNVYDSDEVLSIKLDMKLSGVRRAKTRLSQKAYEILGGDVFRVILHGDDKELKRLETLVNELDKITDASIILPLEIKEYIDLLCLDQDSRYALADCDFELAFLRLCSIPLLKDGVDKLDVEKLGYLLRILRGESGSIEERLKVVKILNEPDLSRVLNKESQKNFVSFPQRVVE